MCQKCNQIFKEEAVMKLHIKKHNGDVKIFKCKECGKTYKCECFLILHMKKREDQLKGFFCNDCNSKFTRNDNLYKHKGRIYREYNINFNAAEETFKGSGGVCKLCEIDFRSDFEKCKAHLKRRSCKDKQFFEDNDLEIYYCEICDKSYLDKDSLKRHINWKHKISEQTTF